MAKEVLGLIKLQIPAGGANPSPPVGPALGQHGVNIMAFCKEYNAKTQEKAGLIIPVEISVFEDRSFTFITKTPPWVRGPHAWVSGGAAPTVGVQSSPLPENVWKGSLHE